MIIDAHCHIAEKGTKRQSIGDLLRQLDRFGVARAILCPSDAEMAVQNEAGNQRIAQVVRSHPDRLAGMAVANPWYGDNALNLLRHAQADGLRGLKLHSPLQGFQLSDEVVDPLIEFACEAKWPVYCHTGTPVCAEPLQLTELARRHPGVAFIMGHMGWSDFAYDTINAATMAGNIFLETSHMVGTLIQQAVTQLGADRVLFGSDSPVSTLEAELCKFDTFELTETERACVLGNTAERLFGMAT